MRNLESSYDCANAGEDLPRLKEELASLQGNRPDDPETQERINRIENQIKFITNKCDING